MKDPARVACGKKSRRKGATNERIVAKMLTAWWGREFARTPSSGGWGTKDHREGFNACGDIVTTANDFPFTVEVKSEEGWELEQLLRSPGNCQLMRHWEQTVAETPEEKIPLLLFTRKFRPWYAMFNSDDMLAVVNTLKHFGRPCLCLTIPKYALTLTALESILKIPKAEILQLIL